MAMSDSRMAAMGMRERELTAEITDLTAKRDRIKEKLLTEMQRRNAKGITPIDESGATVQITRVIGETLVYDYNLMIERLGPKRVREFQVKIVDKTLLARAVQAGKVDPVVVAQCSSTRPTTEYVRVTIK